MLAAASALAEAVVSGASMDTNPMGLVQSGGVLAFAGVVWWELRQQRLELAKFTERMATLIEAVRGIPKSNPGKE
jgi:hypothetical protein